MVEMEQMPEKKRKILLKILEINDKTDFPKVYEELEKNGVDIHENYVRRCAKEFGEQELIETEPLHVGERVFWRIEPKYDKETFRKLARLFLNFPDRAELLKSDYAQKVLDDKFLESQVEEFKEYLQKNEILEAEAMEWIDILLSNHNIFRNFPIGLYYLMFPSELEKELSLFKKMGKETSEHFDRLAKVFAEEITPEQVGKMEKMVDYFEEQNKETMDRLRKRIDRLRESMGEKNENDNSE